MAQPMAPERETLTEQIGRGFEEGGLLGAVGAGLRGAAGMFLPQAGQIRNPSPGDVFRDFVEFAPVVGDVLDIKEAVDPSSDLDWLERSIAALPLFGLTLGGAAVAANTNRRVHRQRNPQVAQALIPIGGETSLTGIPVAEPDPDVDPELMRADPVARQKQARAFEAKAARWRHPNRFGLFETDSFEELSAAIGQAADYEPLFLFNETRGAPERLRQLGRVVVQRMGPEAFGMGEGFDMEQQELSAAQWASVAWLRALDEGVVRAQDRTLANPQGFAKVLAGDLAPEPTATYLNMVAGFTEGIIRVGLGPNLVPDPQSKLGSVWVDPNGNAHVVHAIKPELLPTARHVNATTGEPGPIEAQLDLSQRYRALDYETVIGDFAVNLITELLSASSANPKQTQHALTWYRRANKTARYLSEVTGKSMSAVSAVFSVLSPQTSWVPDNLVAAIHAILRYSKPDLDPASGEYRHHFVEAIKAGGWEQDLYQGSNAELRRKFRGNIAGLVEHYADPNSMISSTGSFLGMTTGERPFQVAQLLLLDTPWQVVLRMAKTHQFAYLFTDPLAFGLAVIDTHSNHATLGTIYTGKKPSGTDKETGEKKFVSVEPLGSTGTRSLRRGEEFEFPTGARLREQDIEAVHRQLLDLGLTDESVLFEKGDKVTTVASYIEGLRKVPSNEAARRYDAQQAAHALVAELMGMTANQVQSGTWVRWQKRKQVIQAALKRGDPASIVFAQSQAVQNRSILDHLDGNPTVTPTAVAKVATVSDDLNDLLPEQAIRKAGKILVEPVTGGRVRVYADPTVPGVGDLLRHAAPTRLQVGGLHPYLPRKARQVSNVDSTIAGLAAQTDGDGNPILGQSRIVPGGAGDYVGFRPGNWIVAEYRDRAAAEAAQLGLEDLPWAFGSQIRPVSFTQHGLDRNVFKDPEAERVNRELWELSELYMEEHGIDPMPIKLARRVDEARAMRAADVMQSVAGTVDPESFPSYEAFISETMDQYKVLVDAGWRFTWTRKDPYESSAAMLEDADRKRLRVFYTDLDTMPEGHPLARLSGVRTMVDGEGVELSYNDIFRAVHDVFGHAKLRNQFGPIGEENAWRTHARMYSPEARRAMTAETRMQNSWVNFGPHMRDTVGRLLRKGQPGYLAAPDRPFAERSAFLPPDEFVEVDMPEPETTSKVQLIVELGGVQTGVPWEHVDEAWQLLGRNAVSRAAYVHGKLWAPPGTVEAVEHVYTDPAGRLATWRTRGDTGVADPHRVTVYVPEAEAANLSVAENRAAAARRTKEEVAAALTVDIENNRVTVDGDLVIQYPEGAEVSAANANRPLTWKVDGQVPRSAVIDLAGPTSTILPGVDLPADKGRVRIDLSRGFPTRIEAFDVADAVAADQVLGALALDADLEAADILTSPDFEAEVAEFEPFRTIELQDVGLGLPDELRPLTPEVKALQDDVRATIEEATGWDEFGLYLTDNVRPEQARDVADTIIGLFTEGGRYTDFVAEFGPLPRSVSRGVIVSSITEGHDPSHLTLGATPLRPMDPRPVFASIYLNESAFVHDTPTSRAQLAREKRLVGYDDLTRSEAETTLIHEIGHAIHATLIDAGYGVAAETTFHRFYQRNYPTVLRHLSQYATWHPTEAWAEVFTNVVLNPKTAPLDQKDLVRWALNLLKEES